MDFSQALTSETFQKASALMKNEVRKAGITTSDGLTGYNLEAPAKLLVSFLAPFRQTIGRVTKPGGSTNWKRITGITRPAPFVAFGAAAAQWSITSDTPTCAYKSMATGGRVVWEAEVQGRNFEDLKARSESLTLLTHMHNESHMILGGNKTTLGTVTVTTPTKTASGGNLGTGTYIVKVSAITAEGWLQCSGVTRTPGGAVYNVDPTLITPAIANLDGASKPAIGFTVAGASSASAAGSGSANILNCSWTAVKGAFGYAVWVDDGAAGTQVLQAILPAQTKVSFTKLRSSGTPVPPTADSTVNANAFDGIVAQLFDITGGSPVAYLKGLGAPLSSASGNQIPEIAAAIQSVYDNTKGIEPDRLLCGWPEANSIDKVLTSVSNDRVHIVYQPGVEGPQLQKFKYYQSPITGKQIPIDIVPELPGGMIIGFMDSVPLPNSEIPAAWQMHMGQDYVRIDYPMTQTDGPNYLHEVRQHGALAGYATKLHFVLYDVHPS